MTKLDYLNAVSDLRRIAFWVATKQNDDLVRKIWKDINQKPEFKKYLNINFKENYKYLAEELLTAGRELQQFT